MLTLSPPADIAARIHDLTVVSDRTTARRASLLASTPAADVWAGPAAAAFADRRLAAGAAALQVLSEGLRALASLLAGVLRELATPPAGVDASSPAGQVRVVQLSLGVPADGMWGPVTALSVRRFQARSGLGVTGVVDVATGLALAAQTAGGAVRLGSPALRSVLAPRSRLGLDDVPLLAGRPKVQTVTAAGDPAAADGGTADGGTADGGTADGGTADGGTADGDASTTSAPVAAPTTVDAGPVAPVATAAPAAPIPFVGTRPPTPAQVSSVATVSADGYDPSDPDSDPGPGDPEPVDAGPVDAGTVDPGPDDAGPIDAGPIDPGTDPGLDSGLVDP